MEKSKSKQKIADRRLKVYEVYMDSVSKSIVLDTVKKLAVRYGVTEVTIFNDIKVMKRIIDNKLSQQK